MPLIKIQIITKTRAREQKVVKLTDSVYEVSVKSAPIRGRANGDVVEAIADHFHIHKNKVEIISGFTSVNKVVTLSLPKKTEPATLGLVIVTSPLRFTFRVRPCR